VAVDLCQAEIVSTARKYKFISRKVFSYLFAGRKKAEK